MAAIGNITVAVERAMHDALRDLAQNLYDTHGVKLNSATISWNDISSIEGPRAIVDTIMANSETA